MSIVLVLFAGAALLDWILPIDNPVVRLLLMWSIGLSGVVMSIRQVVGPWLMPLPDSALALWIEQQDASWRDRLASALSFEAEVQGIQSVAKGESRDLSSSLDRNAIKPADEKSNGIGDVLRRQVVDQVNADRSIDRLPYLASARGVLWPAFLSGMVLLSILGIVAAKPAHCEISWERFVSPWSGREWPRHTLLELRDVDLNRLATNGLRCVADEPLTLYVTNSQGELPADLWCEQRSAEGEVEDVTVRLTTLKDDAGIERTYGVINLHPRAGELLVRARGGDDREMVWHRFDVVAALRIDAFRVTVIPPEYTGMPATTAVSGVGHVDGLVGSQVQIQGTANRPLSSVLRMIDGAPGNAGILTSEGMQFEVDFTIDREGRSAYWFDLHDEFGLGRSRPVRYEIVGRVDHPPTIEVRSPHGHFTATATAELPLLLKGQDDLGIARIALKVLGNDRRGEQEWVLYSSPRIAEGEGDQPDSSIEPVSSAVESGNAERSGGAISANSQIVRGAGSPPASESERPLRFIEIDRVWSLESFKLQPGETIEYQIEVVDIKAPLPNAVRSPSGSLTILSAAEKQRELLARQAGMRQLIERLLIRQRPAQQGVGELLTQAVTVGELRREDLALVRLVEHENRRIQADLNDVRSGLNAQATGLVDELQWNGIVDPPTIARMQRFQEMIADLTQRRLPAVSQSLAAIRRQGGPGPGAEVDQETSALESQSQPIDPSNQGPLSEASGVRQTSGEGVGANVGRKEVTVTHPASDAHRTQDRGDTLVDSLRTAHEAQQQITTTLESMLAELSEWEQRRDVGSGLSELLAAQEQIHDDTRSTGSRTLSRRLDELGPQDRADLSRLADRQRQLTHQLRELTDSLNRDVSRSDTSFNGLDPRLRELVDRLQTAGIEGDFNSAARAIETNAVGDAARLQQRVIAQLTTLNQFLRESERQNLETQIEEIRKLQDETESLRKKQQQLRTDVAELRPMSDDPDRTEQLQTLKKRQQELATELSTVQTKLHRLALPRATAPAARSATRMQDAARALEAGDGVSALRQQQEALDDLMQLEQSLAEASEQATAAQMQQELAALSQRLIDMQQSQRDLQERTTSLQQTLDDGGRWNRTQLKEVRDIAEQQHTLADSVAEVAEKLQQMTLIHTSLEQARRVMEEASRLLDDRQTDSPTQVAQGTAVRWLERLQHALDADTQQADASQPPAQGENGTIPPPPNAGGQTETLVMELRLLRGMLADLSTETAKVAQSLQEMGPRDELIQRRQQLLTEQTVLTELSAKLLEPLLKPRPSSASNSVPPPAPVPPPVESSTDDPPVAPPRTGPQKSGVEK